MSNIVSPQVIHKNPITMFDIVISGWEIGYLGG